MDERPIPLEICRSVWALLEIGKPVTMDRITEATGKAAAVVRPYVDVLLRHGYIWFSGTERAVSGETVCQFRMLNRTGRDAPFIDCGKFVDPNLAGKPKHRPKREFPSLPAIMRLQAEQHPGPFSQAQMIAWCGVPKKELRKAWDQLRWKHEIESMEEKDSSGLVLYTMRVNEKVDCIREFFKANLGRDIRGSEIKAVIPNLAHGAPIARAMDMLAAEGFAASITSVHATMALNIYRVEKTTKSTADDADGKRRRRQG